MTIDRVAQASRRFASSWTDPIVAPSGGRVVGFDGLRGFAVLLVVISHANVPFLRHGGMVGVQVFFVLSGYLITNVLLNEQTRTSRIALPSFYARRFLRLSPALIAAIVGGTLLALAVGEPFADIGRKALVNLLYLGNLDLTTRVNNPFGHLWTIAMEEQFYLVWPVLLIATKRLARTWVFAFVLAGAAASLMYRFSRDIGTSAGYRTAYFSPLANVYALLLGCAGALWLTARTKEARLPSWVWKVSLIGLLALASVPGLKDGLREADTTSTLVVKIVTSTVATVPAIGLVAAVATASAVPGWLTSRALVYFGTISYGLYLWHAILDWTIGQATGTTGVGGLLAGSTSAILAVGVATLSYRFIETPFLQRRDRFTP